MSHRYALGGVFAILSTMMTSVFNALGILDLFSFPEDRLKAIVSHAIIVFIFGFLTISGLKEMGNDQSPETLYVAFVTIPITGVIVWISFKHERLVFLRFKELLTFISVFVASLIVYPHDSYATAVKNRNHMLSTMIDIVASLLPLPPPPPDAPAVPLIPIPP